MLGGGRREQIAEYSSARSKWWNRNGRCAACVQARVPCESLLELSVAPPPDAEDGVARLQLLARFSTALSARQYSDRANTSRVWFACNRVRSHWSGSVKNILFGFGKSKPMPRSRRSFLLYK